MMNKIKLALLLTLCSISSILMAQGIAFVDHDMKFNDILAKAKAEKKLVFVDAYTTWCGPCKWMSSKIFPMKEVGDFYNTAFVSAKIDMEKGEGLEIAQRYHVQSYPTYLFLNGDGELVHRTLGSKPADKFIEDGQSAVDPNRQLFTQIKKFENGEKSPEFLKNLNKIAQEAQEGELASKAAMAYLETQKDWNTKENMEFIINNAESVDGKLFQYVIKNKAAFEKISDAAHLEALWLDVPLTAVSRRFYDRANRKVDVEKATAYLNQYIAKEHTQQVIDFIGIRAPSSNEVSVALKNMENYLDKYSTSNSQLLNEFAWTFYEKTEDKAQLTKALSWSLKSIDIADTYAYLDTAASLYYKLGDKNNAKIYAQKAISKAKESGEDATETEALLKKIESM